MALPEAIQANEVRHLHWTFLMYNNVTEQAAMLDAFISMVERLERAELVVEWKYHRSSGLPFTAAWLPAELRRGRLTVDRVRTFTINVDGYRASLERSLRDAGRRDLADRVKPRATEPPAVEGLAGPNP